MTPHPLAWLAALAVAILLCRPWLEARRPIASLGLLIGVMLGPGGTGLIPSGLLGGLQPLKALAAGWLALLAAESLDLETLRRLPVRGRLWTLLIPAAVLGTLGWFVGDGMALPLACLALALDPDAVRHALSRVSRADLSARFAPMLATVALGLSLLCSVLTLQAPAPSPATAAMAVAHGSLTLLLGVGLGLFFVGPLRLAQGKEFLLALIVSLPLLGWGLATRLGMSAPAVVFVAGLVLAHDRTRRELFFTLLREHERLFTVALMTLTGAGLGYGSGLLLDARFWWLVAALAVARPLAWGLTRPGGLTATQTLTMSPLALTLAALGWGWQQPDAAGGPLAAAAGVAFVLGEVTWLWLGHAPAARQEAAA
ncbi:MAG TPA: hypothetical protein VFE84_02750 [Patescibacteria group bacterium]|nr:hypothetical protein [Patescibacteria group bacterium]